MLTISVSEWNRRRDMNIHPDVVLCAVSWHSRRIYYMLAGDDRRYWFRMPDGYHPGMPLYMDGYEMVPNRFWVRGGFSEMSPSRQPHEDSLDFRTQPVHNMHMLE